MSSITYGILTSGSLGMQCLRVFYAKHSVHFVLTDKRSEEIISFCKENKITYFVGNPRNGAAVSFLVDYAVDVLLSINYLFLIEPDLINFPRKYAVNFHGSLLPKYRGRTPHVWAIINNEKETGVTAHFIADGCDTGDIIYQQTIAIDHNNTGADILQKYHDLYPTIVNKVIDILDSGNFTFQKQVESKATYFGKRGPDDGQLSWAWQKERIYNWVRAQAKPYPGAFTYYKDQKVTIHAIRISDHGFSYEMPNGLILEGGDTPVIKTANGAIQLIITENDAPLTFEKGEILYERF